MIRAQISPLAHRNGPPISDSTTRLQQGTTLIRMYITVAVYQHVIFNPNISNNFFNTYCVLIYIQQDATLHSLFYLETVLHVSDGTTTHHQERIQLYLQHLVFVTQLLLPVVIAAGSSNGLTNTRCCRYSCLRS